MIAASNTFGRRLTLAQTFPPTQNGSLTEVTHGLQNVSGVTNYDLLVTTTTGGLPRSLLAFNNSWQQHPGQRMCWPVQPLDLVFQEQSPHRLQRYRGGCLQEALQKIYLIRKRLFGASSEVDEVAIVRNKASVAALRLMLTINCSRISSIWEIQPAERSPSRRLLILSS